MTLGVLTGIGVGLSTTPGVILTARYFDKRRGIANAFCLSGTAAGSFTLPFLIENLLEEYGFRGTMLVLGACMLHILVSSALYRPLAVHIKITQNDMLRNNTQKPVQACAEDNENTFNNGYHRDNLAYHPIPW